MTRKEKSDEILKRAVDPQWWQRHAEYLKAAGNSVIDKSNRTFQDAQKELNTEAKFKIVGSPEMWMTFAGVMLLGFSLENLLKGLIVYQDKKSVWLENDKLKTTWDKKGHDLQWLINQTGVSVSKEEAELLSFLTMVTVWGGRYPVPKSMEDLGMEWNEPRQKITSGIYERVSNKYSPLHAHS